MAKKLNARKVETIKEPGYYGDGDGLYLQVSTSGTKSWIFRYQRLGRAREMGLGSLDVRTLAEAREAASDCRRQIRDGIDPIDARHEKREAEKAQRDAEKIGRAKRITFREAAESCIKAKRARWNNAKHADQWTNTLTAYAFPVLGSVPVAEVDTAIVLKALQPIWERIPETGRRVRSRIEAVLGWATASGYRTGDNPARWRDHLANLLPAMQQAVPVKNHPALPYQDAHEFMKKLRQEKGTAPRALEFLILNANRSREVAGAKPEEFDLDNRTWMIPSTRMKTRKPHRVPLCPRSIEIVREQLLLNEKHLFPGHKASTHLSSGAMPMTLERLGYGHVTTHGFRSTFRTWCAEQTAYPWEMCEIALAHNVGTKVEQAYQRSDMMEKRRRLMNEWARYIDTEPSRGKVVGIKEGAA